MYKFITAKETIIYWYIGNLALCVIKIYTFSFSCLSKCHLHFKTAPMYICKQKVDSSFVEYCKLPPVNHNNACDYNPPPTLQYKTPSKCIENNLIVYYL